MFVIRADQKCPWELFNDDLLMIVTAAVFRGLVDHCALTLLRMLLWLESRHLNTE